MDCNKNNNNNNNNNNDDVNNNNNNNSNVNNSSNSGKEWSSTCLTLLNYLKSFGVEDELGMWLRIFCMPTSTRRRGLQSLYKSLLLHPGNHLYYCGDTPKEKHFLVIKNRGTFYDAISHKLCAIQPCYYFLPLAESIVK